MKHIFFSILTALAFWQCKDAAPKPKNTLSCYVRLDEAGQQVKAEASLFDGVSKQAIDMPGGLRFQSTEMKLLPVRGITYTVEFPAKYTSETVFDWKDKKGGKQEFKLAVPHLDSFFFSQKVLSLKESAILRWVGKPLDKRETLVFIWENAAEGKTVPMEVSTTLGAPLIELPATKLAQLGPGDWTLYLVRKQKGSAELADCRVESMAEYYTKPIPVRLVN